MVAIGAFDCNLLLAFSLSQDVEEAALNGLALLVRQTFGSSSHADGVSDASHNQRGDLIGTVLQALALLCVQDVNRARERRVPFVDQFSEKREQAQTFAKTCGVRV